jgi:hypothetical protein
VKLPRRRGNAIIGAHREEEIGLSQDSPVNQPSHAVNQVVGLLVFGGGILLLALVFAWAYHLYAGLDANFFCVKPIAVQPHVVGVPPPAPMPPSTVIAAPQPTAAGILPVGVALIFKLFMLLAMGWVGALIASKGIALALGPARAARPAGE